VFAHSNQIIARVLLAIALFHGGSVQLRVQYALQTGIVQPVYVMDSHPVIVSTHFSSQIVRYLPGTGEHHWKNVCQPQLMRTSGLR
jgi:hypothetical protein